MSFADVYIRYGEPRVANVSMLYVEPGRRHRGLGTSLLFSVARAALAAGCVELQLDDMSDGYRSARNLYTRAGFLYESDTGCEMKARVTTVLTTLKRQADTWNCSSISTTSRKHSNGTQVKFLCAGGRAHAWG